ncbi:MAG: alpha-glucosidase [Bacteroidetes bacterium]|nr:alpha-glucosidase [Bacteroidota bacterium]
MPPRITPLAIATGILFLLTACVSDNSRTSGSAADHAWWKETIVYQLYPRSFKDSDGDGIGDLKGIISKLDYIKSLGVDAVWLNPIYASPNDDNGYDISDYRNIMKDFGTMADFDTLLKEMHARHIRLIMDLVVNHTSDEHSWFQQSRSSRNSPYRNYYHWWNAERGKPTPRWSFFDVNSDAWKYDSATNAYYLHYFSRKQPDLNWENPQVRKEVYDIMKFWLDKGIDGFRMDAFQFVAKDTTWPTFPPGYDKNIIKYYGMGPHLHDYLQEMNKEVIGKYDIMTVAEGAGSTLDDAMSLVDPARHELNMAYHFEGMDVGSHDSAYDLLDFKRVYTKWDSAFAQKGWVSIFLGNHDQPRMLSHWASDEPQYRDAASKMLNTFILTMRGTPYCYYGDELGMSNIKFDNIHDYRDIATINKYLELKHNGGDTAAFIQSQKRSSRDNGRTPFQWDATPNAGFTTGTPWLKVNPNYTTLNQQAQAQEPSSILNYFKKLTQLRHTTPALTYGAYTLIDPSNPNVYAYTRQYENKTYLILLNFKSHPSPIFLPTSIDLTTATPVLSNYPTHPPTTTLQPYEALIYDLTPTNP